MSKRLSRQQLSLLLYLETCAVDHTGLVDQRKMNAADFRKANEWNKSGFVKFGRICSKDIGWLMPYTHWCEFSEDAWTATHSERKARANRLLKNRDWQRTEEQAK